MRDTCFRVAPKIRPATHHLFSRHAAHATNQFPFRYAAPCLCYLIYSFSRLRYLKEALFYQFKYHSRAQSALRSPASSRSQCSLSFEFAGSIHKRGTLEDVCYTVEACQLAFEGQHVLDGGRNSGMTGSRERTGKATRNLYALEDVFLRPPVTLLELRIAKPGPLLLQLAQ